MTNDRWGPILIGMRGAGKSTLGSLWAERLGLAFADADVELERRVGLSIAELVATQGEAGLRAAERPVLDDLLARPGCVVATGGGAVLHDGVRDLLGQQRRLVVWLRARVDTLAERVAGSNRPSLTGAPVTQELAQLLGEREALYRSTATHAVDTDGRTPMEVLADLSRLVAR